MYENYWSFGPPCFHFINLCSNHVSIPNTPLFQLLLRYSLSRCLKLGPDLLRISVSYQRGRYPVSSFRCKMLIWWYTTACSLIWRHAVQWCHSGHARVASSCCLSARNFFVASFWYRRRNFIALLRSSLEWCTTELCKKSGPGLRQHPWLPWPPTLAVKISCYY
jgi:hypothetical protein